MTLNDILSKLTTANLSTTIKNAAEDVITFVSGGYQGVESDILARNVKSWAVNGKNLDIVMEQQTGTLTLSASTATLTSVGDTEDVSVTAHTGELSAVSSNEEVATVSVSGTTVTIEEVAAGSATITVTSAATGDYAEATATISVTCTE